MRLALPWGITALASFGPANTRIGDYIVYMDSSNGRDLRRIFSGDPEGKCVKLLSFVPEDSPLRPRARMHDGSVRDVADPWWTHNFDDTYRDVSAACVAMLESLEK